MRFPGLRLYKDEEQKIRSQVSAPVSVQAAEATARVQHLLSFDIEGFIEASHDSYHVPEKYVSASAEKREIEVNTNSILELLAECRALGGCEPGEAKLTRGYHLPARFVIHTVGPIWRGGKRSEAQILANCYRNSLQLAVGNEIKTIAFPAIACGAYGYPIEQAARTALQTTREFLAANADLAKVIFALWDEDVYEAFAARGKSLNS